MTPARDLRLGDKLGDVKIVGLHAYQWDGAEWVRIMLADGAMMSLPADHLIANVSRLGSDVPPSDPGRDPCTCATYGHCVPCRGESSIYAQQPYNNGEPNE